MQNSVDNTQGKIFKNNGKKKETIQLEFLITALQNDKNAKASSCVPNSDLTKSDSPDEPTKSELPRDAPQSDIPSEAPKPDPAKAQPVSFYRSLTVDLLSPSLFLYAAKGACRLSLKIREKTMPTKSSGRTQEILVATAS